MKLNFVLRQIMISMQQWQLVAQPIATMATMIMQNAVLELYDGDIWLLNLNIKIVDLSIVFFVIQTSVSWRFRQLSMEKAIFLYRAFIVKKSLLQVWELRHKKVLGALDYQACTCSVRCRCAYTLAYERDC